MVQITKMMGSKAGKGTLEILERAPLDDGAAFSKPFLLLGLLLKQVVVGHLLVGEAFSARPFKALLSGAAVSLFSDSCFSWHILIVIS